MPQAQLQPLPPQPLPLQIKKIIADIKQSSEIDIQQVIRRIDHLFNSAAKKIFGEETVEEILKAPHSQQSKDLNAACAMFLAFKEKMLEILAKAWALLVKRIPILILRRYAGSVVETTLAALTAALMWAHKHQAEAAQAGKSSPMFALVESLLSKLTVLFDKHCTYLGKMAEAHTTVAKELAHMGIAEERADHVITALGRHLRRDAVIAIGEAALAAPDAATPLYESLFQRLDRATTAEIFSRVLGEIYDNFMTCIMEVRDLLQVGSKVAERGLADELQIRMYAFEHRAMFTAAARHNVYDRGDVAVVDETHRTNDQLKELGVNDSRMAHTQSADESQKRDSSPFSTVPRPVPPVGGRSQ